MCGICGFIEARAARPREEIETTAAAMALAIAHRGPDDAGAWAEPECGLGLGHRRLSIIDLSPAGHQPMTSHDGRWVMVYNGEVYNFAAIRARLEAEAGPIAWRGHSDSEVILQAVARWGVAASAPLMNGMFAIAFWDRAERRLWLLRDRLGKKPLYYGWCDGPEGPVFLFGSELKSLAAHPGFRGRVDRDALTLFLRHNYVPGPYCIIAGLHKLTPGAWLMIDPARPGQLAAPTPYWSARDMAQAGQAEPLALGESAAAAELERLLLDAVGLRMIADVPLGAFLSGGLDSSLVAALMQAQASRPVKTFSIGFPQADFDEAPHAKRVADHLGTEHTELYVTWQEALEVIPRLGTMFDEPFADSSQIPTFLVAAMARRHVTVALSGDAGDELFGGYDRYFLGSRIWRGVGRVPEALKPIGAQILLGHPPAAWDALFRRWSWLLPRRMHWHHPGEKAHELAQLLGAASPADFYRGLVSHWKNPAALVPGGSEPPTVLTDAAQRPALADLRSDMMFMDLVSYLPDDILVKVDRATMAVALEARAPLLDHRVVEFAWRLPLAMKMRGETGKWLLRQVLYKYVPRALMERPKMGFGVPLAEWLRGALRPWAEELLDEARLKRQGFFTPGPIRQRWAEHLDGDRAWHYYLWDVLMFQQWLADNPWAGAA